MPGITLGEAVLGAAALGGVVTAVGNNVANKNNLSQQQQAEQNAQQARAQALQGYMDWLKKNPAPFSYSGSANPAGIGPSALRGQPNAGPGGVPMRPQPGQVAGNVMRAISGGLGPSAHPMPPNAPIGPMVPKLPMGQPPLGPPVAGPPMPTGTGNIPPNVQAILSQLAQGAPAA